MSLWEVEKDIIFYLRVRSFRDKERKERMHSLRSAINSLSLYFTGFSFTYFNSMMETHNRALTHADELKLAFALNAMQEQGQLKRNIRGFKTSKEGITPLYNNTYQYKKQEAV